MNRFSARAPQGRDWDAIARLVADSIPNYLVSQLGHRFCAIYLQHLASHPGSYSLAAYSAADKLAGFVLGALDSLAARRLTPKITARLLLAANVRLFSAEFSGWVARGLANDRQADRSRPQIPEAELFILTVSPEFRGAGLAPRLLDGFEEFFHQNRNSYLILTERGNVASNRFYEKIGARLVGTNRHHGREINTWRKPCVPGSASGSVRRLRDS